MNIALQRLVSYADRRRVWRSSVLAIAIDFALRIVNDPIRWRHLWLLFIVTGLVTLPWSLWRERRQR